MFRIRMLAVAWVVLSFPLMSHAEAEAAPAEAQAPATSDEAAPADDGAPPTLAKPPVLIEEVPAELPGDTVFPSPQVAVELDLVVDEDGSIREASIAQGVGEPFDSAALVAAKKFQFEPAVLSNGEPTPVRVRFRLLINEPPPPPPAPVKFRGTLLERGTRKPLVGVAVAIRVDGNAILEATTDERGVFSIESPSASFEVVAVPSNHEKLVVTIEAQPGEERAETFFLLEVGGRFQTVVRGRKLKREVTKRVIPREQVLLVAGTQGDAIKVVENLPGSNRASSSGPGAGEIVLRGSNPGDSLIFLEGHEIPLIYHFGALRSTFNSAFLESVDFVPGNFSGEFGRASGGVVQVRVRDLDEEMFRGNVDLNLYDSGFVLEGPLGDGWTGGFAFHRSYADVILGAILPESESFSFKSLPRYYDYQFIVSKKTSERGRFRAMFYGSLDKLAFLFEGTGDDPIARGGLESKTMFHNIQLQYTDSINDWIKHETSVQSGLTKLTFSFGEDLYFNLRVCPLDFRSVVDFDFSESVRVRTGIDIRLLNGGISLNLPRPPEEGDSPTPPSAREFQNIDQKFWPVYPGGFVELSFKPVDSLEVIPSVRFDYYSDIDELSIDPRLMGRLEISDETAVTAGFGVYQRPPDPWESDPDFGTTNILPERSVHASLGIEKRLAYNIDVDLTGFYKWASNIVVSNPDSFTDESVDPYVNDGTGRIYGAELLVRFAPISSVSGWVSYSYQKSFRQDTPEEEERVFDLDQPNILTMVGTWKIGSSWSVGARMRYVTGNPWTPIERTVYSSDHDIYVPIYGETNSERFSPFVQLDVRIDKTWIFETWKLNLYLDVQNATNRGNQEGWIYSFDYSDKTALTGLPVAPILGLKGEW